ncbi:hypothetical protein GA0116948_11887 [Chitinophaga costaii]|uniref:Uncharacterized protein n=2 Tax=Chitinophaga costaii TaxID=1335309 RepID=A0A1C4FZC3_9BACT|nr:hypothetical protein DCM91_17665 [Chitinophaga costaii]SCC61329.1 hypothetical protein GA0116948_11887 [Chitinophaga costaii]
MDALAVRQQHFYAASSLTLHGRPVIYCGDEESLHKKMHKDQDKRSLPVSSDHQNGPVAFPLYLAASEPYTAPLPPTMTQLFSALLQNKPVKGFREIFHPPCNA